MKLLYYSSMLLLGFITKVLFALLILIKNWLTFVKVLRVGSVESSNIPVECSDNSNQSNTAGVGVLSEDDAHVSLAAKFTQLSFNTPEVNVSSDVRAEHSPDRSQSNPFERFLNNNDAHVNLSAKSVQFISTSPEVNVNSNVRAESTQNRNQSNIFEAGISSSNGACVNFFPARSVQLISSSPEVNASYNVGAECTQNKNQSDTFEAGLLINNSAYVNQSMPASSVPFFNNVQAVNVNLTENNFDNVSGLFDKIIPTDVAKTYGGVTNFESRASSIAVGDVELMPVSGRKRFKSARYFYEGITHAAGGSSLYQGDENMPLILTHRKRKFCGPFN